MRKCLLIILSLSLLVSCRERNSATTGGFESNAELLHIASKDDPESLDPRKVRDLGSVTYLHMLYEGLTRLDFQGKPIPALAKEWEVSPDQKTYTLRLRESRWSNGQSLTAEDFIRTWKSVLSPNFAAPNAYQFYLIKGAKAAKLGQSSLDDVGMYAPDPHTLVIELSEPAPFFPELLAAHFFYPVPSNFDPKTPVGTGPFTFNQSQPGYEWSFKKNPHYWDEHEVHLDGVVVAIVDNHTALRLFENREIDWIGSPLGSIPQEAIIPLKKRHQLQAVLGAGVHWLRVNTHDPLLKSNSLRKALALAINRKQLVDYVLQGNQKKAESILPPSFSQRHNGLLVDGDIPVAWELFQKALAEMDLSKDDLGDITLIYPTDERSHKIAQTLQQQWFKALGITIKLQRLESQLFLEKVRSRSYQLATGSWYADFRDPINFLEIFKNKAVSTNMTNWENQVFTELLQQSAVERNPQKRLALLNQAEEILMAEMPVIPLYFASFNYVKDVTLLGVLFSDLGYLDFKYAFFSD